MSIRQCAARFLEMAYVFISKSTISRRYITSQLNIMTDNATRFLTHIGKKNLTAVYNRYDVPKYNKIPNYFIILRTCLLF
jgi:hypothetical protein